MRIVIASKNENKIAEVERVLEDVGFPVDIVRDAQWPDVEETEPTLAGNALLKARAVVDTTGLAAVADDTGLFVDALNGAPGVRSARFAGLDASDEANVSKLLSVMEHERNRSAHFKTAIAFVTPDGDELVVEGVLDGAIGSAQRGTNGFGYDPIFVVGNQTLAERSSEEKAHMSHRALALHELAAALRNTGRTL
jgi:XTP/dITP diphosphohydrolase